MLAEIDRLAAAYAESAAPLDELLADSSDVQDEERRLLAAIKETEARTLPLIEDVINARMAGNTAEAQRLLLTLASPAFTKWLRRINNLID